MSVEATADGRAALESRSARRRAEGDVSVDAHEAHAGRERRPMVS
jgi:hypothetical protein